MSAGTLYTFKGSGNNYKVRLLEALLGIELKHEELDFLADQQHSPDFLKINPRGEVPCLVDGDKTFNDSSSILTWLAGKWADGGKAGGPSSYWSNDLYEQAQIISWLAFANSWVQYGNFTNRAILSYNGPHNGLGNNQQWPQGKLDVFLEEGALRGNYSPKVLDAQLNKNEWLVLGRPTIADISVFVYISLAEMGDISLKPYSNVRAWIERIKGLPPFFLSKAGMILCCIWIVGNRLDDRSRSMWESSTPITHSSDYKTSGARYSAVQRCTLSENYE